MTISIDFTVPACSKSDRSSSSLTSKGKFPTYSLLGSQKKPSKAREAFEGYKSNQKFRQTFG